MYKLCIFAGTTEGRELSERLSAQPVELTVCVATGYGQSLLPAREGVRILTGRLDQEEMEGLLLRERFDLVIDATHPYAQRATESILAACRAADTEYLRLLRDGSKPVADAVYVPDAAAAAAFLEQTEGAVLLTNGSKELPQFASLTGFAQRVYARVLPAEASLLACRAAGLPPSHVIAMQGPFSEELNLAMLRAVSASWLVTKDGGGPGGFDAKAAAARRAGAGLVVIGRPAQRAGVCLSQALELLGRRVPLSLKPHVTLLGIGPGAIGAMTREALQAARRADCLIGAGRMLAAVAAPGQRTHEASAPGEIAGYIRSHAQLRRFAVVLSGDTGFFSGAKRLLGQLDFCDVTVLPGLSSLTCLCARLQTSYEDVYVTSLHGRRQSILPDVQAHRRVFVLLGGETGPGQLCRALTQAGLGAARVSVGENLSYPEERITQASARELADQSFAPLSVVLIERDGPDAIVTPGLPDRLFQRGSGEGGVVPMTKSEVRALCLSKLQLTERSVCWDVGAGTGSVAIEMALLAKEGQVYAIERQSAAVELLRRNKEAFFTRNLSIVDGSAPECCLDLPAPSHAFIGGSAGKLRELVALLREKTPGIRIVATAISLETTAALTACMRELSWRESEVVCLQVARGAAAGGYHLMRGENPIHIFTLQAGEGG